MKATFYLHTQLRRSTQFKNWTPRVYTIHFITCKVLIAINCRQFLPSACEAESVAMSYELPEKLGYGRRRIGLGFNMRLIHVYTMYIIYYKR